MMMMIIIITIVVIFMFPDYAICSNKKFYNRMIKSNLNIISTQSLMMMMNLHVENQKV